MAPIPATMPSAPQREATSPATQESDPIAQLAPSIAPPPPAATLEVPAPYPELAKSEVAEPIDQSYALSIEPGETTTVPDSHANKAGPAKEPASSRAAKLLATAAVPMEVAPGDSPSVPQATSNEVEARQVETGTTTALLPTEQLPPPDFRQERAISPVESESAKSPQGINLKEPEPTTRLSLWARMKRLITRR
jgi:hypothetical protein